MDADGGNQQKLTNNPHLDGNPAWFGPPLQLLPPAKNSRHGDASNRSTDNCHYRLFLLCIGVVFENKRRVDPLFFNTTP